MLFLHPSLSPCQLCCCSLKFDCVRSDWFTHDWSSGVSFSQVSVSSLCLFWHTWTHLLSSHLSFLVTKHLMWIILLWNALLFPILFCDCNVTQVIWVVAACYAGLFLQSCRPPVSFNCLIFDIVPGLQYLKPAPGMFSHQRVLSTVICWCIYSQFHCKCLPHLVYMLYMKNMFLMHIFLIPQILTSIQWVLFETSFFKMWLTPYMCWSSLPE